MPDSVTSGDAATVGNIGSVVAVRGSVVDVRFALQLPPVYALLHAGRDGRVVMEVLAQTGHDTVRAIALTPTQGLARGMRVTDSGGPTRPYR